MLRTLPMTELKRHLDLGMAAQVKIESPDYEGVHTSKILRLEPGSIVFAGLVRQDGAKVELQAGQPVEILFLLGDAPRRYVGRVGHVEGEGGPFELLDGPSVEVLDFRKKIRIGADFPCSHATPGTASPPTPARICDIDLGGAGMVSDAYMQPGTKLKVCFSLPGSLKGECSVEAEVRHLRAISVKGSGKLRYGLLFTSLAAADAHAIRDFVIRELERISKSEVELRTSDCSAQHLLYSAKAERLETAWDRAEKMKPQCGFGELGICCRNCLQGPCRVDPFGEGASLGICGASADTIVARNLIRMIAGGASSHIEHGRHATEVLYEAAHGSTHYKIADEERLKTVARRLGITAEGRSAQDLAVELAQTAHAQFAPTRGRDVGDWLRTTLPEARLKKLAALGLLPGDLYGPVVDVMHRSHTGVDVNPASLLAAGVRCSLADYAGMHLTTDVSDVVFGVPAPRRTSANLAVIDEKAVNIAVQGHNPIVAEAVCEAAHAFEKEAIAAGAQEGINVVGICCSGTEVLMRRGVPLAANYASQELAIHTGALEALVIDYQCIMPGIVPAAECFHTRVITTHAVARMPESRAVTHIELDLKDPVSFGQKVVREALTAFTRRNAKRVSLPKNPRPALAGFSVEAIVSALRALDREDPLRPVIESIKSGDIEGVALLAGCNNVVVRQDYGILTVAKGLLAENVLVLATGCCGGALAKAGLLSPEATEELAGPKLRRVLTAIGNAAGLGAPLPPALHMGACVDNTRAVDLAVALANRLGVDLHQLPLVASAPEAMSEKAISIGTFAAALGLPVHLGVMPPIAGGKQVAKLLTEGCKKLFDGYFLIEENPYAAVEKLLDVLREKRQGLLNGVS